MSFKTNDDPDQDQDQATTTLSHAGTTMFQSATTTTEHGSTLMDNVQDQPFENSHDEFTNHIFITSLLSPCSFPSSVEPVHYFYSSFVSYNDV